MGEASRLRQDRGGHTKGRSFTDEHRRKISEALKGKPHLMPPASEQRKQKVSESLKRYHARKRAEREAQAS